MRAITYWGNNFLISSIGCDQEFGFIRMALPCPAETFDVISPVVASSNSLSFSFIISKELYPNGSKNVILVGSYDLIQGFF